MRESLSRYDSDLLLGLRPALFYGIGSMLRIRIQVAQLKRLSFEGRFFCFYRCRCKRVVVPTNVVAVHLFLMQALCKIVAQRKESLMNLGNLENLEFTLQICHCTEIPNFPKFSKILIEK